MFESVSIKPPDAIFGITDAFNADTHPDKINLSVGVYRDSNGKTPILQAVREAERRLLDEEDSKAYRPIPGDPIYGEWVRKLLLGAEASEVASGRAVTAHCPGGTGALRVVADYVAANHPEARVWVSDPTWANHHGIFAAAGVETLKYPYFDPGSNGLNFDAMVNALSGVKKGDMVLLHGCCHNPTGVDPTLDQWQTLGSLLSNHGALPLVDFAYQGFAEGIDADAAGLRVLMQEAPEVMICSSFSKNFGLYNERTGALTVVANAPAAANAVMSQVKHAIRTNYSNPPAHGASIVRMILTDGSLRKQWEDELSTMRSRIHDMRTLLVRGLTSAGVPGDFSFIQKQRGMFSFSGLHSDQVAKLRDEHSIYIVGSGRINVAGISEHNVERLCSAIRAVVS